MGFECVETLVLEYLKKYKVMIKQLIAPFILTQLKISYYITFKNIT